MIFVIALSKEAVELPKQQKLVNSNKYVKMWRKGDVMTQEQDIPYQFTMSVRSKYFQMIKSGQKDIELRAYDDKRKKIKIGDIFQLFDAENPTEYIFCKVINMHIAQNFESLFKEIDIKRAGFMNLQELENTITKFIPKEKLDQEQVVGIEIERVQ